MATYLVKGGRQLSGVYEVSGAKNAGPKLIIAAMLSDKDCVLRNIPRISEMETKVKIKGASVIEIIGVAKLLGEATGESMNARLEAATAITLAALNGGKIKIKYNEPEMLRAYSDVLENIGITLKWSKKKVWADKINKSLTPITVKTAVYPGFMTDWQPIIVLLLVVKAHGRSEVLEMIYEKRWSARVL